MRENRANLSINRTGIIDFSMEKRKKSTPVPYIKYTNIFN
jgi:hypothetical protein